MDILALKLLAAIILVVVGVAFGLLPYRVSVSEQGERWLQFGIGLAGGVFVGAGLLHLLPDSVELLGSDGLIPDYPTAFLITGIGFLLILFLEQVLLHGRDEDALAHEERFPFVLFLVLSIHSFIAGTAMGLETSTSAFLIILLAILVHKGFAALALGISLIQGNVPLGRMVRTIVAFSLMTPLGLLVGTVFTQILENDAARLLEGLFDALAAGTFLYIASFEMLVGISEPKVDRVKKFAIVSAGFVVMALLAIWA